MKFERDEVRVLGGVRHGRTLGGPVAIEVGNSEWAKWEQVMSPDPVDAGRDRRPGPQRPADPPAPRPRRPRRHAEVRLHRCTPDPRARQCPRDGRAGGPCGRRPRLPAAGRRHRGPQPRRAHRRSRRARVGDPFPLPADLAAIDESPVRCLDAVGRGSHGGGDRRGPPRRRHPRRRRRGARLRPAAGPGQPRALGPPARLAAGRGAHGHPGDQGRRVRRRASASPRFAAPWPRTRSSPAPRASSARRASPAAPRAACRPARSCACGRR